MTPWLLNDLNYAELKENLPEVVIVPLGATEPHNLHLPYGTDSYEAMVIGSKACQKAHANGANVVMLPVLPFGTETNQREFPLSINLNPSTILMILKDIIAGLEHNGIRKMVILNSHGGNEIKPMLRELYGQTQMQLFLCDWFKGLGSDLAEEIFEHKDDHAGEMETSIIMAYFGDLVRKNEQGSLDADDGTVKPTLFEAISKGWISITRPWHMATSNSGAGYPHKATAEKGKQFVEAVTDRLGDFLVELSATPVNPDFPYDVSGN